jgi:hypothetical protein
VSPVWQCEPVIPLICYQDLLSASSHSFQYSVANICTALELNAGPQKMQTPAVRTRIG